MKKVLIASLALLGASSAFAAGTAVCAAPATAGDATQPITATTAFTGTGAAFVVNSFTPKCSAKVHVAFEQNTTAAAVASGSSAGSKLFTGSTNGGSVSPTAATFPNGVAAGDVTGATEALLTVGSGSGG